jgi:hypothetical protein
MPTVWDTVSSHVAKSDTDHRVTSGSGSGNEGALAGTVGKSTGKWYLEFPNIDTGGFGFGLGFGPASTGLTSGNIPEFRMTGNAGIIIPGGGAFGGAATNPTGDLVALLVDLDASPKRGWMQFNGTWYGNAGVLGAPPAPGDTSGFDLTGATFPWFPIVWLQFNPCFCDINAGDRAFTNPPPTGFNPWDGVAGGNATGATITVTTSLPVTGVPTIHAIDGTAIFEIDFRLIPSQQYVQSDLHSIWSIGDRIANGLISAGEYGWSHVVAPAEQSFDGNFASNNGFEYQSATPQNAGAAVWWTFLESGGLVIEGLKYLGEQSITNPDFFTLYGGFDIGGIYPFTYMQGVDSFSTNVTAAYAARTGFKFADIAITPSTPIPWPHYELWFTDTAATAGSRLANELLFKVKHSNLDGGDRRTSNGDASKRVTLSLSSGWFERTGSPYSALNDSWIDGDDYTGPDLSGHVYALSQIGSNAGGANAMNTAGEYIQFVFPRPVNIKHILFQSVTGTETYVGDDPTIFGLWHWEVSSDNGSSWYPVGDPWSFREDCQYTPAPRVGRFELPETEVGGVGANGRTHWRMVLDAGPAFGGAVNINQVMFDVVDRGNQSEYTAVAFSDDTDGTALAPTIGPPGSPTIVGLSDGTDDKLTFTVTIIPNPVLTVAFDDGGTFDTWSDLYPSLVVQTILVATGR